MAAAPRYLELRMSAMRSTFSSSSMKYHAWQSLVSP
jgi:hypothetical protein